MPKITHLRELIQDEEIEAVVINESPNTPCICYRRRFSWSRLPRPSELILVSADWFLINERWFPSDVPDKVRENLLIYQDPLFTLKMIPGSFDCDYFSVLCSRIDTGLFWRFVAILRWQLIKLNRKALFYAWMLDFLPTEQYEEPSWRNLSVPGIWHRNSSNSESNSNDLVAPESNTRLIRYSYDDARSYGSIPRRYELEQNPSETCLDCKYYYGTAGINCAVHPSGWSDQENQCPDLDVK